MHTNKIHSRYIRLSVLLGVLTTLFGYYGFGLVDQIEQLPLIYRQMDLEYLKNDFFTSEGSTSFARRGYSVLMSLLGRMAPLPYVFFFLTLLCNVSISIVANLTAYTLYNKSAKAGLFASVAVMGAGTFALGWGSELFYTLMLPSTIATPILLLAVLLALKARLFLSMCLCATAALMHPLMGIETAGIIIGTILVPATVLGSNMLETIKRILIASLPLIPVFALIIYQQYINNPPIDTELFVEIIARLRHSHHYLPSTFELADYISGLILLCGMFFVLNRAGIQSRYKTSVVVISMIVLVLCVMGYVFVEILPTKAWTTAQTFRLLLFVKWFSLILLAGWASDLQIGKRRKFLYLFALVTPLTAGLMLLMHVILEQVEKTKESVVGTIALLLIVLIGVYYGELVPGRYWYFLFLILLVYLFSLATRKVVLRLSGIVAALIMIVLLSKDYFYYSYKYYYLFTLEIKDFGRTFTLLNDVDPYAEGVINFAKRNTAEEDVFLTPPGWGQFRLLANRAIVVDEKAFPFSDSAMYQWYIRMSDCYQYGHGNTQLKNLEDSYLQLTDEQLNGLSKRYGFKYAVLYDEQPTELKLVYKDKNYSLAQLY